MRKALILALLVGTRAALAQTNDTTAPTPPPAKPASSAKSSAKAKIGSAAQLQAALDKANQDNRDLLDLLKKQQGVLEDIQYDRRLQSRQIASLEERLTEALQEKSQLETKVAKLEQELAVRPVAPAADSSAITPPRPVASPAVGSIPSPTNGAPIMPKVESVPNPTAPEVQTAPTPPASYLPAAPSPEGSPAWHRILALKGTDTRQTDVFPIQGRTWRVVWHNQDPAGKNLENTSALFINAFPRDDTIPQKVCAKLGSGGDSTELVGKGKYYLKVEASGGEWELAVEDFW